MIQEQTKDMSQYFYRTSAADFMKIPGSPVAYWASANLVDSFSKFPLLKSIANPHQGMATTNNDLFLRRWYEVSHTLCNINARSLEEAKSSPARWFPIDKGGEYRKWYGNNEFMVNFQYGGKDLCEYIDKNSSVGASGRVINREKYFLPGVTWSAISSSFFSVRYTEHGHTFSNAGMKVFHENTQMLKSTCALLNSKVTTEIVKCLSQTLNFDQGIIARIPTKLPLEASLLAEKAIGLAEHDWDEREDSWNFKTSPLVLNYGPESLLSTSFKKLRETWLNTTHKLKSIEQENNFIFIEAYGLQDELTPGVSLEDITLTCNAHYRYGGNLTDDEREARLQSDTLAELVSFAMGCMMGRYSIEKPGMILASQGETLEDYLKQIPSPRFMPDNDAILPLTDQEWFADDATNRFREFVRVVWGDELLQENLDFVAESLCLHAIKPKRGESALDTIRRYLSTQFYKDHMRTYKKRPIYWLFSSGKQKAFECLVYLHRYNEGILARMRTEYVIPLTAKLTAYADKLEQDKAASASAAETKRLEKEITTLHKQQAELAEFDEKLRHYADQRIALDLDDGVKVNYGKFGNLLAEVKVITGEK